MIIALSTFLAGLRDIRHAIGRVLLIAVHIGVVSALLTMSGSMTLQYMADANAASALVARNAAYFIVPDGRETSLPGAPEDIRGVVVAMLDSDRAYSLDMGSWYDPANPILIAYGAFPEVFHLAPDTAVVRPYALAGEHSASRPGDVIAVNGRDITVAGSITGAGFVDLWMGYTPLDHAIVVVDDPSVGLSQASDEQIMELAARMVLLSPDARTIADYVTAVRAAAPIIPRWAADKVRLTFEPDVKGSLTLLGVFAAGLLTAIMSAIAQLRAVSEQRRNRFPDASVAEVASYVTGFVIAAWLVPSLLFGWLGLEFLTNRAQASTVYVLLALLALVTAVVIVVSTSCRIPQTADTRRS